MKSDQTTLVIQSFGRESEYKRAILTVMSYYAHTSLPMGDTKVILFTDNPVYFKPYLAALPVHYVLLTPEKIKCMRGAIDFLHRMKIAVIDEAFRLMEGAMLYADSDTFFTADPTPVMQQLTTQKSYMHLWEYRFEEMRNLPLPMGETFHAFLRLIESRDFALANGSALRINPEQVSWNAGVMMFHSSHRRFIPDVYALTDQFYPPTRNHASEQYAFSVMLQNNTLVEPCSGVIYHYWYRVKKKIIDLFLEENITAAWAERPLKEQLQDVRKWCRLLPGHFEQHLLTLQDKAVQAFNVNDFEKGWGHAFKALLKAPGDFHFLKDILYHTKKRFVK